MRQNASVQQKTNVNGYKALWKTYSTGLLIGQRSTRLQRANTKTIVQMGASTAIRILIAIQPDTFSCTIYQINFKIFSVR